MVMKVIRFPFECQNLTFFEWNIHHKADEIGQTKETLYMMFMCNKPTLFPNPITDFCVDMKLFKETQHHENWLDKWHPFHTRFFIMLKKWLILTLFAITCQTDNIKCYFISKMFLMYYSPMKSISYLLLVVSWSLSKTTILELIVTKSQVQPLEQIR